MPSDVQVFVRFKEQCVFAGEELNCVITFKNVAELPELPTPGGGGPRHNKRNSISQSAAAAAIAAVNTRLTPAERLHNARSPSAGREERPHAPRHQSSFSLSLPSTPIPRGSSPSNEYVGPAQQTGRPHRRSISIKSITSPVLQSASQDVVAGRPPTKSMGHRRSSTMQVTDELRRTSSFERQLPLELYGNRAAGRRSPLSASHSPTSPDIDLGQEFKFPGDRTNPHVDRLRPSTRSDLSKAQHHRVISAASRGTSHRTSAEIYSRSNHSDETLASEQISTISERPNARTRMPNDLIRQHYKMGPAAPRRPQVVALLMGYAQISATFTLDSSLVDQTPFEEVKKKGFLGGQAGGGVVGVKKKARQTSSLWSGFNFASIGESLESMIGGETSSSIKEMKAVTNSRAIPLLSTPQSLLFVDVHLEPGEEKSFTFSCRLPRGLPASHRGKAIKIVYNLTIGVQGAPGNQQQVSDVRRVNVPFRVFPGVDSDGEILGHDLMQPHVILNDVAKTAPIDSPELDYNAKPAIADDTEMSNTKFLDFVDKLLDRNRRRQSSSSMLTDTFNPVGGPVGAMQSQALRTINRAVMMSNQFGVSSDTSTSPNRFEIASGGKQIAVVTLDRPLHRLGETVIVVVDFSNSEKICSNLRATLETCEKVVPGLAVRSAATISRVTKKVYASRAENVLFMQRAVFCPTIPVLVSPTFITSGVSLDWSIKLEFGTVKEAEGVADAEGDEDVVPQNQIVKRNTLLEELVKDERGVVEVAVESLECDTFEVTIPITVYGDVVEDGTASADDVIGVPI